MSLIATPQVECMMSTRLQPIVHTAAAASAALSGNFADTTANAQEWGRIRRRLSNWQRNPDEAGDDEITPPSSRSIDVAANIADAFAQRNIDAPDQVVPAGDGGLAFERFEGDVYEVIEVRPDGSCEWKLFENCKLQERRTVSCSEEPE
jgi:hypothetical protein